MLQMKQSTQCSRVYSCAKTSCAISALLGCMLFVRPFSVSISMILELSLLAISLSLLLSLLGLLPSISKRLGTVRA